MRTIVFHFALKQAVKYFKNHPDAIPGHLDEAVFAFLARHLGV
ncbi:hypothetical protein SEA_ZIMMER_10 [Mycobacterium phage Zimmer]|nr:hypothetical protein SEA_ZIMMER_10 [Mycobacterium phage Zimmer]